MILTVLLTSILIVLAVTVFDALTHAFTTIATGGFSNYTESIAHFKSAAVEFVIAIFMLVSGINFILMYNALEGDILRLLKDFEARLYIAIFAVASCIMTYDLMAHGKMFSEALRVGFFNAASIISTTGYSITNISSLPEISIILILGLLIMGGCVGSTAGGLKVLRIGTLMKLVSRETRHMDAPTRAMDSVVINKKIVDDRSILNAGTIVFLWLATIFAGSFITLAFTDISLFAAIENMISVTGTTGVLFISQSELLALPVVVKLTYIFSMLAGRLEMIPMLALLKIKLSRNR